MPKDFPALTSAPTNALIVWADSHSIYTSLPGPDSLPYTIRYPRTLRGLQDLLALVCDRKYDSPDTTYTPSTTLSPRAFSRREHAKELLRRLGALG